MKFIYINTSGVTLMSLVANRSLTQMHKITKPNRCNRCPTWLMQLSRLSIIIMHTKIYKHDMASYCITLLRIS